MANPPKEGSHIRAQQESRFKQLRWKPFLSVLVFIFVVLIVLWRAYLPPLDILKYTLYQAVFVIAPGCLLYKALSKNSVSRSRLIGVGWATGFALATVFYFVCAALNLRDYFVAYPAPIILISALTLWKRAPRANDAKNASLGADISKDTCIVLFALMAAAFILYFYIGMFLTQPLPGTFSQAALNNDLLQHIGFTAEALAHFPVMNPQLAGTALVHAPGSLFHLAAAADTTNVPIAEIVLRLNPIACGLCLLFLLYAAGKAVDGKRSSGLIATFLILFVGQIVLPGLAGIQSGFSSLWSNPSYLLAQILFAALLVEFLHSVQADGISARNPHWLVIVLLMGVCASCDPQPIFMLAVGAACILALSYHRDRALNTPAALWLALTFISLLIFYSGILSAQRAAMQIPPALTLVVMLAGSALQIIGGAWALSRAKPIPPALMALAVMFVVGAVVALVPSPATDAGSLTAFNFGFVAGSALAASGLRQMADKNFAAAPSAKKALLAGCGVLALAGFAITPITSLAPPLLKIATGDLAYETSNAGMSSSLYMGLRWLREHSSPGDVIATNRIDDRPASMDGVYPAFAERRTFLGGAPSPARQQLATAVFEDGDAEALKQMHNAYGVKYLYIDRLHGQPVPSSLYPVVSPLYTNDDADIFEVSLFDKYPLPKPISEQDGKPFVFKSELVIDGLTEPTTMQFAKDGRLFIAEKSGKFLIYQNGALLPEPFMDLSDDVNNTFDRGVLGFALAPNFPENPYLYVFYVYDPPGVEPDGMGSRVSRLERIKVDPQNPNRASMAPDARKILLGKNSVLANIGNVDDTFDQTKQSCYSETTGYLQDCIGEDSLTHAGGTVLFARDGSLWVSIGEGGLAGTDLRAVRAQSLDSLAGRIVRINPETGEGYPDNPFYDGNPNSNRSKTVSYGLRNPFRFLLHPVTEQLYIGDVGQVTWEEINMGTGKNFGWPCFEGNNAENAIMTAFAETNNARVRALCDPLYAVRNQVIEAPIYSYKHLRSESVIMGAVYTGTNYPAYLQGALVFADYNWDKISYMRIQDGETHSIHPLLFETRETATSGQSQILQGPDGNLWYVLFTSTPEKGQIRRIVYTNNP